MKELRKMDYFGICKLVNEKKHGDNIAKVKWIQTTKADELMYY